MYTEIQLPLACTYISILLTLITRIICIKINTCVLYSCIESTVYIKSS